MLEYFQKHEILNARTLANWNNRCKAVNLPFGEENER